MGARHPKYAGQICGGIEIEIVDRLRFRPFDCGMRILRRLHAMYGEKVAFTSYLDTLAGIPGFTDRCLIGHGNPDLCDWSDNMERFMARRSRYFLYR